jgi:prevent-host-death family protein
MKRFAAREAKNEFGHLLDSARREPVTIEKNGRPVAVMLSLEDYERLAAIEDAWWAEKARKWAAGGFLSPAKSRRLLAGMLNAKD